MSEIHVDLTSSVENTSSKFKKLLKRLLAGILVVVGFLLSPISWWNDLLVNVPLAYAFAVPFSWINQSLFGPAFVVGYLLTNVLGFILMHHGLQHAIRDAKKLSIRRELKKDILWSVAYTALIALLVATGWVKPPAL